MDYNYFIEKGLRYSFKEILIHIKKKGIFFPNYLLIKINKFNHQKKTQQELEFIIEKNNYQSLEIYDEYFEVEMLQDNEKKEIKVFYDEICNVEDESAQFSLTFNKIEEERKNNIIYIDNFEE